MGNRGCVKGVRMGEGVKAMCEKKNHNFNTKTTKNASKFTKNDRNLVATCIFKPENGKGGGRLKM